MRLRIIFVSRLSSAPPMTKRVPAGVRDALLPLTFRSLPLAILTFSPFPRPFFFAAFCSGFCAWLCRPFFPAVFCCPLWFPAIKRNSPLAARQEFLHDVKLSAANPLSSPGEDMRYLERFAAQDQRVGVKSPLQPPPPIELQNARGVRGDQRQRQFEREAVFGHACANLVVEGARACDRRVR